VAHPLVEHLALPVPASLGIGEGELEALPGLLVDALDVIEQSRRVR
jgi:hypothetical protein